MPTCKLIIEDEVNIKLEGLDIDVRRKVSNALKFDVPYAKHMPQYKLGRWDGKVPFFGIGGTGYVNHLDRIIDILTKNKVSIADIEDRRKKLDLTFDTITEDYWKNKNICWPKGHPAEGQPILLRDYQVEAINTFLKNPQSLQQIATGAGKCRTYDSTLLVSIDNNDFASSCLNCDSMKEVTVQMGKLAESVERYKDVKLQDNCEVNIDDLNCSVATPSGSTVIKSIIKKENLEGLKLSLKNGSEVKCAKKHILRSNNKDIFAEQLLIGDLVETINGSTEVTSIEDIDDTTFYDIAIDSPHLYYDADGVLHHNTITTATLCHITETYGRTLTIVPNKSLVTQTEEDYVNCGLDVGVYFGDRKELGRTHIICTWQSLNILDKRNKNGQEALSLAEFLEGVSTVIVDECFDGNTLITTPQGKTPIKDLKAGDKVINLCEKTKKYKEDTVVKVHKNLTHTKSEKMLELEFDNGMTTQVTANHKFLTNKGWVRADELTDDLEIIDINTYS